MISKPDLTLFSALKMMRASELDLQDIRKAICAEAYAAWKEFLKSL